MSDFFHVTLTKVFVSAISCACFCCLGTKLLGACLKQSINATVQCLRLHICHMSTRQLDHVGA